MLCNVKLLESRHGLLDLDSDRASVATADMSVPAAEKVVESSEEAGEADDSVANEGMRFGGTWRVACLVGLGQYGMGCGCGSDESVGSGCAALDVRGNCVDNLYLTSFNFSSRSRHCASLFV